MPEMNDHDLLIELRVELRALRADVKDIKDNFRVSLDDHEKRLRTLEDAGSENKGRERTIAAFIAIAASAIIETAIRFFSKH